ncbi:hypothetical protein [Frigoribacterium sp. SL97]|uniref:hypothetical protein n=1 Tax=Frigoribacterium sp. SL97 TaxID=2994664 RepID=UPI002271102F|nr:hypothetical protein [Frigoribacterium sp. SL97]WAC52174.1 hypothetical protein OVA02_02550 [Frigoribacterium sp. SL97]
MQTPREYATLEEAMRVHGFPEWNLHIYRNVIEAIPFRRISTHKDRGISLERQDGREPLWMVYGYISGFVTKEEARAATSGLTPWQRGQKKGEAPKLVTDKTRWGVTLPENRNRETGAAGTTPRHGDPCRDCGMVLPLSGVHDCA